MRILTLARALRSGRHEQALASHAQGARFVIASTSDGRECRRAEMLSLFVCSQRPKKRACRSFWASP
jgi:hypothetical protein